MAASMIMGRLSSKNILQLRFMSSKPKRIKKKQEKRGLWGRDEDRPGRITTTNAYYVLIPEIPPDTPETNPIMRTDEYPDLNAISPDNVVMGCAKYALNFDVNLGKHSQALKASGANQTFESLFNPVEKDLITMNTASKTAQQLSRVKAGDFTSAYNRIRDQIRFSLENKWFDVPFFKEVQNLNKNRENLEDHEKSLIDIYLRNARLAASKEPGEDRLKYANLQNMLATHQSNYSQCALISHNLFKEALADVSCVKEMPKEYLYQLAHDKQHPSRGPWMVTLNPESYYPIMAYCTDRGLRYKAWFAHKTRASVHLQHMYLGNHIRIQDLRWAYKDIGEMMGYKNYAQLAMEHKMAGSIDNVLNMIESLKNSFKPIVDREMAELQDFATSSGFRFKMEWWDVDYYRRRHRSHMIKNSDSTFSEYFTLNNVLKNLFDICEKLYGVTIQECTGEEPVWNNQIAYFKVFDTKSQEYLASFYMDPFARENDKLRTRSYMEPGRDKSGALGITPYCFLKLGLNQPFADQPVLMQIDDVAKLFSDFGTGLEAMLSTAPYSELAGSNNVELDAERIVPFFMKQLLFNKDMLKRVSSHVDSGESLSDDLVDVILQSKNHFSTLDVMFELYLSALDLELFINEAEWMDVMKKLWPEFMPLPLHKNDNHPCAFFEIFVQKYTACFYSVVWSKMIAADIYKAFEEVGFEDLDKLSQVGRRFRETYLEKGGVVSATDLFRRFRGRDPTQDAFIEYTTKYVKET